AAARASQTFLIYRDGDLRQEFTYGDFYQRCCRVANFMRHELGIRPGDRIATFAYNHPLTVIVNFAAWLIGACVVPISVGEADDRVQFIQENAEVRAIFVMPDLTLRCDSLRRPEFCIEHYVQMTGAPVGGYSQLGEGCARQPPCLEETGLAGLET